VHDNSSTMTPAAVPIVGGQKPKRNQPCPCGSSLKYKHCHGDPAKIQAMKQVTAGLMSRMIRLEQMKKGLKPWPYTCKSCGKGFTDFKPSTIKPGMGLCPHCDSVDFEADDSRTEDDE